MEKAKGIRRANWFLMLDILLFTLAFISTSCQKEDEPVPSKTDPNNAPVNEEEAIPFKFSNFLDHYGHISSYEQRAQWGFYNVHDPAILRDGDYYYSYSTDASYGNVIGPGIQMRRSKDLINWQYIGLAFNGLPQDGASFIRKNGGEPFNSLWAPYVYKYGSQYRLYYSLSSPTPRLSVIGLATANSPRGPWIEKGLVVTSLANNTTQTNAIDPTVIIAQDGAHWFYYGSAWDGIYKLQLNPATGLALSSGNKGTRIAQRGFTDGQINGNIEGPEIIYNAEQQKYYLFIAYDWLETKYNVRVGRSDSPEGPFYDFHGRDINEERDDSPMILGPYRFNGHAGYQGISHPGVFQDDKGQYFMATQARPADGIYFMTMHIRKIFWTEDGWPVVSPQRYGGLEQKTVTVEDLVGVWEYIEHGYEVVPGFAEEQRAPGFQISEPLTLHADGTFNTESGNQWIFEAPWLTLTWQNGSTAKVYVEWGRDWENRVYETIIFTGLNNGGTAVWAKKLVE